MGLNLYNKLARNLTNTSRSTNKTCSSCSWSYRDQWRRLVMYSSLGDLKTVSFFTNSSFSYHGSTYRPGVVKHLIYEDFEMHGSKAKQVLSKTKGMI